jgi:hypothetical protein
MSHELNERVIEAAKKTAELIRALMPAANVTIGQLHDVTGPRVNVHVTYRDQVGEERGKSVTVSHYGWDTNPVRVSLFGFFPFGMLKGVIAPLEALGYSVI